MKALISGAAVALVSGLLMGAALKPDLGQDDRPAGPQMMAWNGVRSTGPFDDSTTLASYKGKLPDYVLGTDFKTATTIFPTADAPPAAKEASQPKEVDGAAADVAPADMPLTRASYADPAEDDPPPQPSNPSIEGGAPAPAVAQVQPADAPDDPTAG